MEFYRKTLFSSTITCDQEINRLRQLPQNKCLSPELIPSELADSEQWLVWSYQVGERLNGMYRANKQPYKPTDPFSQLRMDNISELSGLNTAISSFYDCDHIDGIGYMFLDVDGLIGIDLDNCRDANTGKIRKEFQFLIKELDSYSEVSPSGTGIKIWVKAFVSEGYFPNPNATGIQILNFANGEIEIYRSGQYFTVTTQVLDTFDTIRNTQNEIDVICEFSKTTINKDFDSISGTDPTVEEAMRVKYLYDEWIATEDVLNRQDDLDFYLATQRAAYESTNTNEKEKKQCKKCGREYYNKYELCSSCANMGIPEAKIVSSVSNYFSNFKDTTIQEEYDIQLGTYTPRADVVLIDEKSKIVAIAECKREFYEDKGIKQLKSYLCASDTQFGIFANSMNADEWIFFEKLRGYNFKKITKEKFESGIDNPNTKNPILTIFGKKLNRLEELTLDIDSKEYIMQDYQKLTLLEKNKKKKDNKSMQLSQETQEKESIFFRIREVVDKMKISDSESNMVIEQCHKELVSKLKQKKETISQIKEEISQLNNLISNLEHEININTKQTVTENKQSFLQIEQEIEILKSEKRQIEEDIGKQLFLLSTQTEMFQI